MSSDPAKSCSLPFRNQKEEDLTWKKGDPIAHNLGNPPLDSLFMKTIIPANERKWIVIDDNRSHGGDLSIQVSNMVTKMVRRDDQDERGQDGSYHCDTVRSVLLKAFARNGAETFSDNHWIHLIHEGSSERRVEYCVDHKNSLCYLRAIQGHSGGIPVVPELVGYTSIPYDWKEYIFHRGCSWDMSSILGSGLIPGGKENDKARQAVFFTPLNLFGEIPDEEQHHEKYKIPQKVHCHSCWKHNQDAVYWIKLSRAQDQGLQFSQTKSLAIITHNPVPGDCIYRVVSKKGD